MYTYAVRQWRASRVYSSGGLGGGNYVFTHISHIYLAIYTYYIFIGGMAMACIAGLFLWWVRGRGLCIYTYIIYLFVHIYMLYIHRWHGNGVHCGSIPLVCWGKGIMYIHDISLFI